MRYFLKFLPRIYYNVISVNKISTRNFAKALNQQQVPLSHPETLTGRILLYLQTNKEPHLSKCKPELLNLLQQETNLFKLSTNELLEFAAILHEHNLNHKEKRLIRELDVECCLRLPEFTTEEILNLMNVFMNFNPDRIVELKFYNQAIKILYDCLDKMNKHDLLQFMFYVGLRKKTLETQTMLRQCIKLMDSNLINNLSIEELCIICNSTFKTSTKILNKNLLEKVKNYINNNLNVLNDSALLVTLIKTLRHNRYQDEDLLNTISCTIFFNKTLKYYSFSILCHIMALYADYFFFDENLFKVFTEKCLEQLKESSFLSKKIHPSEQLRGKDIKRFLWIMSMFSEMKLLKYSDIKNVIIPKLLERIEAGEFNNDLTSLVDITLYLWMLNYQPNELVPYIFTKKSWQLLATHLKTNLRLNLLLHAICVENPDFLKTFKNTNNPSSNFSTYQLHKRPLVEKILYHLQRVGEKLDVNKFELSQEVPHLNIIGITGYKNRLKKALYVEVLDDYNLIKNIKEDVPVGLMALKLRLLNRSDEGVLVVSKHEIEDMADSDLNEYLLDEIKLIC